MKKRFIPCCVVILAASMLCTSCLGEFALTKKVLTWNKQISNKFVNELVFFGLWILPVYEISALADVLVINSVEFWSGTNPVVAGNKTVVTNDGRYFIAWDETGYTITNEADNSVTRLNFDKQTSSWSVATPKGDVTFLTYIDESHVKMPAADGSSTVVELSHDGVLAYKEAVGANAALYAKR